MRLCTKPQLLTGIGFGAEPIRARVIVLGFYITGYSNIKIEPTFVKNAPVDSKMIPTHNVV